ncbi:MAG TPA: protease pro-enzyme activation domain-containing protein [Thermoplasmata archaeon]|nr:protease pro-enzyme activation domain-containing protein [Thermoplasmata archaeon]
MRSPLRSHRSPRFRAAVVGAAIALLASSLLVPGGNGLIRASAAANASPSVGAAAPTPVGPFVAVPTGSADRPSPGATPVAAASGGNLSVVVSFALSNNSRLARLLATLRGAAAGSRGADLSPAEFAAEYGGAPAPYRAAVAYFSSFGVTGLTTAANRGSIAFEATPAVADRIFNTSLETFDSSRGSYVAPVRAVELPAEIAAAVTSVSGLRTGTGGAIAIGGTLVAGGGAGPSGLRVDAGGGSYPAPPTVDGVQYQYAPDYQVAYDESSLFAQYGDPTNASVALLTFAGTYDGSPTSTTCGPLSTGADVGGWDATDVADYFSSVLPAGEPAPTVVAVPLGGAQAPSCLSSWDSTGVAAANTVALETIGAVAPGATIYGVYLPGPASEAGLVTELSEVLGTAPYDSATVVVTPWTFNDTNDSGWYGDLQEAAAQGVTIVTAAGNSADDPASADWNGSDAVFPASMAYAGFGSTAVGGVTSTLNASTLVLASQRVWNVSAADTAQGGPRGTGGGVSAVVAEPSWQLRTLANAVIGGSGRGVPDVAGLANNTAATVSVDGARADALNASGTGPFFDANGTGIAAAIVAGELAEVDHALLGAGDGALGFADPDLYAVGNVTYGALPHGNGVYTTTPSPGGWDAPVPALPFRDVTVGRNFADVARTGYDLVTGWGTVDAYNLSMYLLVPTSFPSYGPLGAVNDRLTLSDLNATPYKGTVYASVQANLFVANSLGAPVDWVQAYLQLSNGTIGKWYVNFSASIAYPFFGIYSAENFTLYTGESPAAVLESFPLTTNLTVTVVHGALPLDNSLKFSFGTSHASYTLRAPGAEYILGGYHHSYSWQGVTYEDGPYGDVSGLPGFLAPQVGLYGPGGGATGAFLPGTSAVVTSTVEPLGSTTFLPSQLFPLDNATSQTGEVSQSLTYAIGNNATADQATVAYTTGPWLQGVITAEPFRYAVNFSQTGTPTLVNWYVNVSNGLKVAALGTVGAATVLLDNGSYTWTAAVSSKNYTVSPGSGPLVIDGSGGAVALNVTPKANTVTFTATGPKFPFAWSVDIAGGPTLAGSGASLVASLTYAKYSYTIVSGNSSWAATHGVGEFTLGSSAITIPVVFALVTYAVKISPAFTTSELDQPSLPWTVTVGPTVKTGTATAPFTFDLPNGSYAFSISGLNPGYRASPSSGSFVVDGKKLTIVVQIIAPNGGLFGLGSWGYVLVGAIALAAIGVVIFLWRRRRRRAPELPRPPPPPVRGRPRRRRDTTVAPDEL